MKIGNSIASDLTTALSLTTESCLANHLLRERDALFTFLSCPGLEATNWRAERAIRPKLATKAEACGCIKGCLRPPCHLVDSYAPRRSLAYQNM